MITRQRLSEVKRKLADMAALRRELEPLIGQCRHGTIAERRIIEALATSKRALDGCPDRLRPVCCHRDADLLPA